jgi:tight adherence protein C
VIAVLAVLVFLLVTGATAAIAWQLWAFRARALDRVAPRASLAPVLPSPVLFWKELVGRIGAVMPSSPKDLPLLKKRLVKAGWRHPSASVVFQGARALSTVVLCGAAAVVMVQSAPEIDRLLLGIGAAGMFGWMLPSQYLSFRIKRRQRAIARGLPNALDLMVVCVESGLGIDQTVIQVAKELQVPHPEICDEFSVMNLELRAGKRRAEALHNLADRTGVDDLRKLVAVLVQTDRFGTSIAQSLRMHADYLRALARQRAEEQASKLAVKLVFPIFFCVLPSLFVVTVGPVMTRMVKELIPMIEKM